MPDGSNSRSWRRYLRLSLRGLMVLVLLAAVGLGWIVRSAATQREAVAAIRRRGGTVRYNIWVTNSGLYSKRNVLSSAWLIDRLGVDYFDTATVVYLMPDMVHRDPMPHGPFDHRDFDPILSRVAQLSRLQWWDMRALPALQTLK